MRAELESRNVLDRQNSNPGNIHKILRHMKQKLVSYEEICEEMAVGNFLY